MQENKKNMAFRAVISSPKVSIFLNEETMFKIPITVKHTPTIAAETEKICIEIFSSCFSVKLSCGIFVSPLIYWVYFTPKKNALQYNLLPPLIASLEH
jgi:hypothetical protein